MNYIKWLRNKVGTEKVFLNFASGCIRNDRGEILLQRRSDKKTWGFPGGAIELGESAEEAVIREIKEETGLDVRVHALIGVYTKYDDHYPSGDKAQTIMIFFDLNIIGGNLCTNSPETLELQFFAPDSAPPLVNKQHEDALLDVNGHLRGVYR
ncbi:NUDIX hydrolase [Shouchella lonarensis]|uniref:Mutator mutT protein n=1 Tax=Shouchella lonarensis TaxID=1464122 RepID=A0A1G6HLT4_9BACI|nr:NUDIX domain-containing protein [Shouchella lonarensis]SDB94845.1 mutator mutT protein [Shouchella lonarensis]